MKEKDIRDSKKLSKYQKLVDCDFKKILNKKKYLKKINLNKICCNNYYPYIKKNNITYYRCNKTGSFFANPRLNDKGMQYLYQQSESADFWYKYFFLPYKKKRIDKIIKPRVNFIVKKIRRKKNIKKVLDIGSGSGEFLKLLKEKNNSLDLYGIEPSITMSKQNYNIKIFNSTLENFKKKIKFDLITSFELLEHVSDPLIFITKIKKLMKKNSVLYLTSLNGEGFDIDILKENSNALYPPYHINFFNPKSLETLLKKSGFRHVEIETPGRLDLNIVENNIELIKNPNIKIVLKNFIQKLNQAQKKKFQNILSDMKLSSHMRVIAVL